ncbi:MAG: hypothetical protein KGL35_09605 [Bradyrhizobium sp.]|nr:hypothetical protein [Bradyrhizobium sp.]
MQFALRKINIISQTDILNAEDGERGRIELNLMLKGMMKHKNLWRHTQGAVSLVASTGSYVLSPNPYRIIMCQYRNTSSIDIPMFPLTRTEYYELPMKTSTGLPTNYYFDPQRDTGTLLVWPVPANVTTETIQYTYQRRFEDVSNLEQTIDITQEGLEVVGYSLASRLTMDYGQFGPPIDAVNAKAGQLLQEFLDQDRAEIVRFAPDYRYGI